MNEQLIKDLIQSELKKVDAKWPNYHSHHEAYAVIKEEVEELEEDFNRLNNAINDYWKLIRHGKTEIDFELVLMDTDNLKFAANNIIKEAVQVYVTALRAERLIKNNK